MKFSFERAKAEGSTNKAKKAVFDNIASIAAPDAHTVILTLNNADGTMPFRLGENTAVILSPKSAATTATKPIGTGPYTFDSWQKGQSITLVKWPGYRNAAAVKINRVTFRFINDPAAQVAALLAGDIDGMPRFGALQSLKQFQGDKRFTVEIGDTAGKGIMTINNRSQAAGRRARAPRADARHRPQGLHRRRARRPGQADRQPLRAHRHRLCRPDQRLPLRPGEGQALLKEAGVATPLNADDDAATAAVRTQGRRGHRRAAGQGGRRSRRSRTSNGRNGSSGTFKGNFDLTIINHVEPLDYMQYANTSYYWGYDSKAFRDLAAKYAAASNPKERSKLFADMQKKLAEDAVNAYIFNPAQVAVAKKGLKGLWASSPIVANDIAAVSWVAAK